MYSSTKKDELYHKYEYPGIHRSLLWGITALRYHLESKSDTGAKFYRFSSGYRCHDNDTVKKKGTTNHMGKAADILFYTRNGDKWSRPEDCNERNKTVEAVRMLCTEEDGLKAQYEWSDDNRFSMETTAQGAKTWVHIDIRQYKSPYLSDKFFVTSHLDYKGQLLKQLFKDI